MRTFIRVATLSAMSCLLFACASQPNQNLEQARANFDQLQNNAKSRELAPLETKDAQTALERADRAASSGADKTEVDHQAYLVDQRVALANQTIALKEAEQQLEAMSGERAQVRLAARDAQIGARDAELRRLRDELEAKESARGAVITLGDVLFEFDEATLMPAATASIQRLAAFLKDNPERMLLVEGFTDNVGSDNYNLSLSQQRADSVRHALVAQGVDQSRITTAGLGKAHPVSSNDTATGRAMNRRVEVTISYDDNPVPARR